MPSDPNLGRTNVFHLDMIDNTFHDQVLRRPIEPKGWWALLGWDTKKTRGSDGYLHGPYETWQVIALVIVLGLLAVWLGHKESLIAGPVTAAIMLAVCFGVSAQFDPEHDGLWVAGALSLAIGSFAGISLVALITRLIEGRVMRRA